MKNYVQLGDNVTLPAPAAVASGEATLIGGLFGVASTSAAQGEDCAFVRIGVFTLPKAAGAWTPGQKLYWDATAKNVTTTAGSNTLIGAALAAAASGDTSGAVILTGQIAA